MKLHLPSVLVSIGVIGAIALLMSQSPPATLNPAVLRVEYVPHPRDMVQITSGTPYTVPSGKIFVLTALGIINGVTVSSALTVNGVVQVIALPPGCPMTSQPAPVANGFSVAAGSVIELSAPDPASCRAWGYLASQ